ncbi:MAG: aryl-sulfate sulfotransferase, partial [Candidatus Kapaibacterium sp.]
MNKIIISILILSMNTYLYSEQTIGLFYNTPQSYDGYTIFAPTSSDTTYLIDNCGEKVHTWVAKTNPGNTVYLLDNGVLLKTGKSYNTKFNVGGNGGLVQMLDWDSNLIWEYYISDSTMCQHHDIEPLPNGNILALVWVTHTKEEAIQAGRVDSPNELWSEKIIEIKPDLVNGGGEIVWEWDTWDHYVQDVSAELDNYGDITNPRKININYSTRGFENRDWLHFNSIDYNSRLDQIMLSNHNFGEIIIIDHSTTSEEARTDKGGKSNHGGDLLYRWGNPMSYGQGTEEDIRLFVQHDPHWIPDTLNDGGKIMVFNNQIGQLEELEYSAVHIIDPLIDENDSYILSDGKFGPDEIYWTYMDKPKTDFFSKNMSGSQRLPNGNTLICEGWIGRFTEISPNQEKVWQYVNPSGFNGLLLNQGETSNSNQVFRVERISKDHPALVVRELTAKGYIENGSDFTCEL